MLPRLPLGLLRARLEGFPAVALLGPRQCGKTTLARSLGGAYYDLEQAGERLRLDAQWAARVAGRDLVVLDEAQAAPDFFPRLRGAIDADRSRRGRFLLLGSISPALMKGVSESLAGRLAIVELTPLLMAELAQHDVDDVWLRGGYPDGGILEPAAFGPWQDSYLTLLAQRDLPAWGLPAKPQTTARLLRMLASLHGQMFRAQPIGAALALDGKTVARYCDYLEGAYLIRRLSPFAVNSKKRLVKTPRVFWRDTGLLHALMGVRELEQLFAQPWVGHSWEGFVVEQTLATLAASGIGVEAGFFRTSDDYELDLVVERAGLRVAVEVKLTSEPTRAMVERLHKAADMVEAAGCVLVCRAPEELETDTLLVTNVRSWVGRLPRLFGR